MSLFRARWLGLPLAEGGTIPGVEKWICEVCPSCGKSTSAGLLFEGTRDAMGVGLRASYKGRDTMVVEAEELDDIPECDASACPGAHMPGPRQRVDPPEIAALRRLARAGF